MKKKLTTDGNFVREKCLCGKLHDRLRINETARIDDCFLSVRFIRDGLKLILCYFVRERNCDLSQFRFII